MLEVSFVEYLDSEVVDDKCESRGARDVFEETGYIGVLVVSMFVHEGDEFMLGDASCCRVAVHGAIHFEEYLVVVDIGAEATLVYDCGWEVGDGDEDVLWAVEFTLEVVVAAVGRDVSCWESIFEVF